MIIDQTYHMPSSVLIASNVAAKTNKTKQNEQKQRYLGIMVYN